MVEILVERLRYPDSFTSWREEVNIEPEDFSRSVSACVRGFEWGCLGGG